MGVQGLWEILNRTGQSRSLTHLAVVDGFEKNESGRRAYRIGINASIWFSHASHAKGGRNAELRMLFFRLRSLTTLPIIPLFVLDGRERPKMKRGSRVGKSGSHSLTAGLKKLLDVFGMEWRMALGEAEAELAYLNQIGVIDAVMTDDVDALVFGALRVMKNTSLNLSGNKSYPALDSTGKPSKHHVMIYTAESIQNHPDVSLSRGGLILFALLSGGDYDSGLKGFGPRISHALARLGFGDQLLNAYERRHQQNISQFLVIWRSQLNAELRTNAHGLLRGSYSSLYIPDDFPVMEVLGNYIDPLTTGARSGHQGICTLHDNGNLSIKKAAAFCEDHFDEWGYRAAIIKRFRNILWEAAVMNFLRRVALEADEKEKIRRTEAGQAHISIRGPLVPMRDDAIGTPPCLVNKYLNASDIDHQSATLMRSDDCSSRLGDKYDSNPLIRRIVHSGQRISTDKILEYRVEVDPTQLVDLALSGIKGKHLEPDDHIGASAIDDTAGKKIGVAQGSPAKLKKTVDKSSPDPHSVMKMWIPASMIRQVHPELVEDFEPGSAPSEAANSGQKRTRSRSAVRPMKRIQMGSRKILFP